MSAVSDHLNRAAEVMVKDDLDLISALVEAMPEGQEGVDVYIQSRDKLCKTAGVANHPALHLYHWSDQHSHEDALALIRKAAS